MDDPIGLREIVSWFFSACALVATMIATRRGRRAEERAELAEARAERAEARADQQHILTMKDQEGGALRAIAELERTRRTLSEEQRDLAEKARTQEAEHRKRTEARVDELTSELGRAASEREIADWAVKVAALRALREMPVGVTYYSGDAMLMLKYCVPSDPGSDEDCRDPWEVWDTIKRVAEGEFDGVGSDETIEQLLPQGLTSAQDMAWHHVLLATLNIRRSLADLESYGQTLRAYVAFPFWMEREREKDPNIQPAQLIERWDELTKGDKDFTKQMEQLLEEVTGVSRRDIPWYGDR